MFMYMNSNTKNKIYNFIDSFFLELYFQAKGRLNTKLLFLNSLGTLEDWDAAVQKTENRLARVNEQRAKVRTL